MTPSQRRLVREPVGDEQGYWAGAPGWVWDDTEQAAYICYRIRRPRGVEPDRGGESRIAKTTDFKRSRMYGACTRMPTNLSIENPPPRRRWPSAISPATWPQKTAAGAPSIPPIPSRTGSCQYPTPVHRCGLGLEGVKDPWILEENGRYFMFLSVAANTATTSDSSHDT